MNEQGNRDRKSNVVEHPEKRVVCVCEFEIRRCMCSERNATGSETDLQLKLIVGCGTKIRYVQRITEGHTERPRLIS